MEGRVFPKGFSKFISYISAFELGIYTYMSLHGQTVELYRWILTIMLGIIFYLDSERK